MHTKKSQPSSQQTMLQSVGHLTRKSGVLGSIPGLATYFCFSFRFFKKDSCQLSWRKYVHEVLVNRLGGLSLPRKSVARLTDRPDMTLDVYRGRKTTIQQQRKLDKPHFRHYPFTRRLGILGLCWGPMTDSIFPLRVDPL